MPKTTSDITKALKLKAQPKSNVLSVKIGAKKAAVPFEARVLQSDNYMFVHVPPAASIFKITDEGLVPVENAEEAKKAQVSFRGQRKSGTGRSRVVQEVPKEILEALSKLPTNHRLAIGADGQPRIVRKRNRKSSK